MNPATEGDRVREGALGGNVPEAEGGTVAPWNVGEPVKPAALGGIVRSEVWGMFRGAGEAVNQ